MEAGPHQQIIQTPLVTLTPRGMLFLLVALNLTIIGGVRIDGDLIALGTAGLLLGLMVIVFGKWNLRDIHLNLSAPSRVFADTPFDLRLTQLNKHAFAAPSKAPGQKSLFEA